MSVWVWVGEAVVGVGVLVGSGNVAVKVGVRVRVGVKGGGVSVNVAVCETAGVLVGTLGTHNVFPAMMYSLVRQFACISRFREIWNCRLMMDNVSPGLIV